MVEEDVQYATVIIGTILIQSTSPLVLLVAHIPS